MATATDVRWTSYSSGLPRRDSKVEWISPDGRQVRGTYYGGVVWMPENSPMYVYYTPTMWRYV